MEYLRKKKIIKEAVEDLQFCFVWTCTVAYPIKKNQGFFYICFALFESCGNDSNQATPQSWKALVKTIADILMSQDMFSA